MQPQINDMERRLGIMQSVEPVLENAIKTLQKVVDVRGMGKKLVQLESQELVFDKPDEEECWSGKGSYLRPGDMKKEEFEQKKKCKDPCDSVKRKEKEAEDKAEEDHAKEKRMEAIEAKEKLWISSTSRKKKRRKLPRLLLKTIQSSRPRSRLLPPRRPRPRLRLESHSDSTFLQTT